MNTKPAQVPTLTSGRPKRLGVDVGQVPRRGDVLQAAVHVPGEPVERAADLVAVAVVLLELAAAVQAGVGVGLDRRLVDPDDRNDFPTIS